MRKHDENLFQIGEVTKIMGGVLVRPSFPITPILPVTKKLP